MLPATTLGDIVTADHNILNLDDVELGLETGTN